MPQNWSVPVTATATWVPMTIVAPIRSPTASSANTDQRADGENSQRSALRIAPGGFAFAMGLLGRENDRGDRLQVGVARGDLLVVHPRRRS